MARAINFLSLSISLDHLEIHSPMSFSIRHFFLYICTGRVMILPLKYVIISLPLAGHYISKIKTPYINTIVDECSYQRHYNTVKISYF